MQRNWYSWLAYRDECFEDHGCPEMAGPMKTGQLYKVKCKVETTCHEGGCSNGCGGGCRHECEVTGVLGIGDKDDDINLEIKGEGKADGVDEEVSCMRGFHM
jgi:hypothetical protein